jgi:hypothetical protein
MLLLTTYIVCDRNRRRAPSTRSSGSSTRIIPNTIPIGNLASMDRSIRQHLISRGSLSSSIRIFRRGCCFRVPGQAQISIAVSTSVEIRSPSSNPRNPEPQRSSIPTSFAHSIHVHLTIQPIYLESTSYCRYQSRPPIRQWCNAWFRRDLC